MREALDQWNFVIAAYTVGIAGTLVVVGWSWLAMHPPHCLQAAGVNGAVMPAAR